MRAWITYILVHMNNLHLFLKEKISGIVHKYRKIIIIVEIQNKSIKPMVGGSQIMFFSREPRCHALGSRQVFKQKETTCHTIIVTVGMKYYYV